MSLEEQLKVDVKALIDTLVDPNILHEEEIVYYSSKRMQKWIRKRIEDIYDQLEELGQEYDRI